MNDPADPLVADAFGVQTFDEVMGLRARLRSLALRLLGDESEANDIVRVAFLGVSQRYRTTAMRLERFVIIACLERIRRRQARPVGPPEYDAAPKSPGPIPANALAMDVSAGLRSLPPRQHAVLMLVDMMGHPADEVAEVLGVPVGTVRRLAALGRARLARLLGPEGARPAEPEAVGGMLRLREGLQRMRADPDERARIVAIAAVAVEDELPLTD